MDAEIAALEAAPRQDPRPQAGHDAGTADWEGFGWYERYAAASPCSTSAGMSAAGNCDKNGMSRDALVILGAGLELVGKAVEGKPAHRDQRGGRCQRLDHPAVRLVQGSPAEPCADHPGYRHALGLFRCFHPQDR
ncbi:MAG: hypothetical protein MZU95_13385 [Desulfomicrobium escambiense]|nr:hypothetical protein [Desulfomicrobium escambiense]